MTIKEFKPKPRKLDGVINLQNFGKKTLEPYYKGMTIELKKDIPERIHNKIETIIEMMEVEGISWLSAGDEDMLSSFIATYLKIEGDVKEPSDFIKEKISEKQAELKKLKAELKDFEAKVKEFELVQNDEEIAKIKTRQEEISKELNIIVNIITESNKMLENLPDGTEMTLPFQIDMIRVYLILVKQQAQKK